MRKIKSSLIIFCAALLIIGTSGFPFNRKFPKFSYKDQFGNMITEENLLGKKTILMHFHLGCPAAAAAVTDLNRLYDEIDPDKYQIMGILENTPGQVQDFFSKDTSLWTGFKAQLPPQKAPTFSLLSECESENYVYGKNGEISQIGVHCRKLSKKLRTRISPSIYWINEKGFIIHRFRAYYFPVPEETFPERKAELMGYFE